MASQDNTGRLNAKNEEYLVLRCAIMQHQIAYLKPEIEMQLLSETSFKRTIKGKEVKLFTLSNKNGCVAQFTNYGARWVSMFVPDRYNCWDDVVLGFNNLQQYLEAEDKYYGATIGRVCGRINQGRFELEGIRYQLANNDAFGKPQKNHLHGGPSGFSFQVWDGCVTMNETGESSVELYLVSPDGEEGYPGNIKVKISYTLCHDNAVRIEYYACTDRTTILNLTNHAYFNLGGKGSKTVLDHIVKIPAFNVIETNEELVPTGILRFVKNTPLDFTRGNTVRSRIQQSVPGQLFPKQGYAVCYVFDEPAHLKLAATIEETNSGRIMEMYTDQPCLQFYNAWLLEGKDIGKNGEIYGAGCGLALEAMGYPDAPNHPEFKPTNLSVKEEYRQTTVYKFSTK